MPKIRFFNTLGRRFEVFEPRSPGHVGIYTCGPTVYDAVHIGNLRTFVFEDVLCRALELLGYEVAQVMNLTDVEDKIIAGSVAQGVAVEDFVAPHIETFMRDLARLHVRPAQGYPRATEHIAEMIELVSSLLERGHAYEAEGSVFFRIDTDDDYGRLSGVDLSSAKQGSRVAADEYGKEDARDFVLWKGAKEGEPSWESPWGSGRPGWHIECSAMSMKYLGPSFDIHCGGVDNIFPHHENEIAQSESVTEVPFVRYWLHSEFLQVEGEKMSKSLGNQYTLDDLVARGLDLRAVRYVFLSVHYRQKMNFTDAAVESASSALGRIDEFRFRLENCPEAEAPEPLIEGACTQLVASFREALADDLNTSAALAALFTFVKQVNVAVEQGALGSGDRQRVRDALRSVDRVLGVLHREEWQGQESAGIAEQEVEDLVALREKARADRDFAESDRIRDVLQEAGIRLEDTPAGARWKRR